MQHYCSLIYVFTIRNVIHYVDASLIGIMTNGINNTKNNMRVVYVKIMIMGINNFTLYMMDSINVTSTLISLIKLINI